METQYATQTGQKKHAVGGAMTSNTKQGLFRSSSLRQTASEDKLTDAKPGTQTNIDEQRGMIGSPYDKTAQSRYVKEDNDRQRGTEMTIRSTYKANQRLAENSHSVEKFRRQSSLPN